MLTSLRISDERYKASTNTGSGYRPGYIRWGARVYEGEDPVDDAATYDDYVIAAADLGYTKKEIADLLGINDGTIGRRIDELCGTGELELVTRGVGSTYYGYRRAQ